MLLRQLRLKGIRSYEDATVRFPAGSVLFEGDIGSGKSTLLYAIEFAFFGTSDLDYGFLVRHGAVQAVVELTIDLDGSAVTIHRELERKKDKVSLAKASWIEVDGTRTNYSAKELKREVLRLLDFQEPPHPTKPSVIYRYAVFTPQEEMKRILSEGPDERLQTLRRAFRIEEYRIARDHAQDTVLPSVRDRARYLDGRLQDVPVAEDRMRKGAEELQRLTAELAGLVTESRQAEAEASRARDEVVRFENLEKLAHELDLKEREARKDRERADATIAEMARDGEAVAAARARRGVLGQSLERLAEVRQRRESLDHAHGTRTRKERDLGALQAEERKSAEARAELERQSAYLKQLEERRQDAAKRRGELEGLRTRVTEQEGVRDRLQGDLGAFDRTITTKRAEGARLRTLEGTASCPTCGQPLDRRHLEELLTSIGRAVTDAEAGRAAAQGSFGETTTRLRLLRTELEEGLAAMGDEAAVAAQRAEAGRVAKALEKAAVEGVDRGARIQALVTELGAIGDTAAALTTAKREEEQLRTTELEAQRLDATIARGPEIARREGEAQTLLAKASAAAADTAQRLGDLRRTYQPEAARAARDRLTAAGAEGARREERVSQTGVRRSRLEQDLATLDRELTEKRKLGVQRERLREVERWLREVFVPALESVERRLFAAINAEFEASFQHWFDQLLEGGDLAVRVDEAFTPIVEQQGYGVPPESLSGGERTALAFAYRLALNTVVRKVSKAMRTTNLMLLDEPTDGFSKEQLVRVQEVLRQLKCDQLIIVSHERELEGSADHVLRVIKEHGVSRVVGG